MVSDQDGSEREAWGTRRKYLTVLLCQLMGTPMFVSLPNTAIMQGATGYMLGYLISFFTLGIPLLYMEFIVSQFTARDCIDVWKVRPCLSHIGYIVVVWQVLFIINNHVTVSFVFHYLLISFENPIPYYTCGPWATKDCKILSHNYTVNEDCLRLADPPAYCHYLYITFPEYQHWKYHMLGVNKENGFHFAWRVLLASSVIAAMTYLSNLKRVKSIGLLVNFFTFYPIFAYSLLLLGSMVQKGVVLLYESALDVDFSVFFKHVRASLLIIQVLNTLGVGSGFSFNLGSSTSFRAPCYSNTVIAVAASAATSLLSVCTTAMMACPYAFEYGIEPSRIIGSHLALVHEKIPRLLYEYDSKHLWIILTLSSHVVLGMSTNIILVHHVLETLATRYSRVAQYPGTAALLFMCILFLVTIPLLGHIGMSALYGMRRFYCYVTTALALVEALVFIFWYGVDRFAEDVHFMQGIQPKKTMKLFWFLSVIVLCYALLYEINVKTIEYSNSLSDYIGWGLFLVTLGLIVGLFLLKVLVAVFKNKFSEVIGLERTWGPRLEVLQRSRAMFTAQAMTKEYLYRQYHLQAGVMQRQRAANCRTGRDTLNNHD